MSSSVIRVGAVAYDPRVVTIWDGFREYFRLAEVPTDYVLFSNYEAQVEALFQGSIDIAWNTNTAYAMSELRLGGTARVLAMRDTDVGFRTRIIVRAASEIGSLAQIKGRRFAFGSRDSAQAAILPRHYLRQQGIDPDQGVKPLHFDLDVGKHGDTGTSEMEVLKALETGTADAGAVGDATWVRLLQSGRVNESQVRSLWTSPPYCHCNFTALPDMSDAQAKTWTSALLAMDYRDPRWKPLMDLEGLTKWFAGRKEGYEVLFEALKEEQG